LARLNKARLDWCVVGRLARSAHVSISEWGTMLLSGGGSRVDHRGRQRRLMDGGREAPRQQCWCVVPTMPDAHPNVSERGNKEAFRTAVGGSCPDHRFASRSRAGSPHGGVQWDQAQQWASRAGGGPGGRSEPRRSRTFYRMKAGHRCWRSSCGKRRAGRSSRSTRRGCRPSRSSSSRW
jgi:hypothetical protein